jgi:hypothetical protein
MLLAGSAPGQGAEHASFCTGQQLEGSFRVVRGSAAAGSIVYALRLENRSGRSCAVTGLPVLQLLGRAGRSLPTHELAARPSALTAVLVTLAPGRRTVATARFSPDVPGPGEPRLPGGQCEPTSVRLRVAALGGGTTTMGPSRRRPSASTDHYSSPPTRRAGSTLLRRATAISTCGSNGRWMLGRSGAAHTRCEMSDTNGNGRNGHVSSDALAATAHGASARCLARALVVGFDACDEADIPLSQLQRTAILESVLIEFDGFGRQLSSLAAVSRLLAQLRSEPPAA